MDKLLVALLGETTKQAIDSLMDRYVGLLSVEQVREGLVECLENAAHLLGDAELLFENRRYARAMALAMTCIEEVGKIQVLRAMNRLTKKDQKARVRKWKQFRQHEPKSTWGLVGTYPDEARGDLGAVMLAAGLQEQLAPLAERLRQVGLYVDYHGDEGRWISPKEVTDADGRDMLERARSCLNRTRAVEGRGLMSVEALRIERDVYSDLHKLTPVDGSEEELARYQSALMGCHKEFYRRLVESGVLKSLDDVTVMGMSLSEFLGDNGHVDDSAGT